MNKIEVGMYIRDNRDGSIMKLNEFALNFRPNKNTYDFEKASYDIIDLIEIGDYVNGYKISDINGDLILLDGWNTLLENVEIKSIVTREMFEQMKYEVE